MKQKQTSKDFAANKIFIKDLTIVEHLILWISCASSIGFFVAQQCLFKDAVTNWTTWFTLFAAILSVFSVIAGTKKRILCPLLGLLASMLLIATSWSSQLYGFVIMQAINIITNAITLITWYRSSQNKLTIVPKDLPLWMVLIYSAFFLGLAFLFAWIEHFDWFYSFWSGGSQKEAMPYHIRLLESISLMAIVACIVPMVKGYKFLWWIYFISDIAMAITWGFRSTEALGQGLTPLAFNCWSTLVSDLGMFVSTFVGIYNWYYKDKKLKK